MQDVSLYELRKEKKEAYEKAIKSLAGYKFVMFGYWCGVWIHLNKLDPVKEPNPFSIFVAMAKEKGKEDPCKK